MQKTLKKIASIFKKLKIIDYLIIIAVILAGIIFFKFLNPEEKWVTATISANNLPYFQANALHVGDFEKDPNGKKIAEITSVQVYNTPQTLVANKDIFLKIKLLVRISPRSKELQYKNKVIKIGSPIEFMFTSGYIPGKIADLGTDNQQRKLKTKIVSLRLYNQWPWFGDAIKIGEGEIGENGERISEIISKEIKPAEITTTTSEGQTLLQTDPRKVEIAIKMKMKVLETNGELIFRKDKTIIIGETMSFDAGDTRIDDAFIEKIDNE